MWIRKPLNKTKFATYILKILKMIQIHKKIKTKIRKKRWKFPMFLKNNKKWTWNSFIFHFHLPIYYKNTTTSHLQKKKKIIKVTQKHFNLRFKTSTKYFPHILKVGVWRPSSHITCQNHTPTDDIYYQSRKWNPEINKTCS